MVIFVGILLAAFPLYGRAIGYVIWEKEKGEDYIKIDDTIIHVSGEWKYNGTVISFGKWRRK